MSKKIVATFICLVSSAFADGWSSPLEIRFKSALKSGGIVEFESKVGTSVNNCTNYPKIFQVLTARTTELDDINIVLSVLLTSKMSSNRVQVYVKDTGGTDSKPNDVSEIVMCDGMDCPHSY